MLQPRSSRSVPPIPLSPRVPAIVPVAAAVAGDAGAACACVQESNENVFVVLDLAPPSAKRIRDLDVRGSFVAVFSLLNLLGAPLCRQ